MPSSVRPINPLPLGAANFNAGRKGDRTKPAQAARVESALGGKPPGLELRGHPVKTRLVHVARLAEGDDRAAGAPDVLGRVDGAEVLEETAENPLFPRQLAPGVDHDRDNRTPRLLGELRADGRKHLSGENLLAGALRKDEKTVSGLDALGADAHHVHQVLARRRTSDR